MEREKEEKKGRKGKYISSHRVRIKERGRSERGKWMRRLK